MAFCQRRWYSRLARCDFSKALESFQTAADKGPNHSVSRLNLGVVYVNDLKDYAKGVAAWEDFLRVEPAGARADSIREQLGQIKQMMAAQSGEIDLPPDHQFAENIKSEIIERLEYLWDIDDVIVEFAE